MKSLRLSIPLLYSVKVKFFLVLLVNVFLMQEAYSSDDDVVGEIFGKPVTKKEYDYYYKTTSSFSRSLGRDKKDQRTLDEVRNEAWKNMAYLHYANEENVTIEKKRVEDEIRSLLSKDNIEYNSPSYAKWVKERFNEEVIVFEKSIEDFLKIEEFRDKERNFDVEDPVEEEMKQKFLNQYNSFESEYIRFDTREEAEDFCNKMAKGPSAWRDTYVEKRKSDGQKGASWINIMTVEALIDLWGIPKDDAFKIMSHNRGDFIVAEFYYGVAVFRLLDKQEPKDMSEYTDKKKEEYKNALTRMKKNKKSKEYLEDLLKMADYKDYTAGESKKATIEKLKEKTIATLVTTEGKITLKLFPEAAPKACENFVGLIEKKYYNNIKFHRVIKDFMIQGGDPTAKGTGGESIWGRPFEDEVKEDIRFDKPGLLAMANSGKNTNRSQFFITTKPNPSLNGRYTIFGEVINGFNVVEKIQNVETDSKDKPKVDQIILKAYIGDIDK